MIKFTARMVAIAVAIGSLLSSPCFAQTDAGSAEHWQWGSIAEFKEGDGIRENIARAFLSEDFARLDALRSEYIGDQGSTPSGISKLAIYYGMLTDLAVNVASPTVKSCASAVGASMLNKWRKASPESPAPIIITAILFDRRAYCYRDSMEDGASPSAWKSYRDNLIAAVTLLEANKKLASTDPEFYSELEKLYTTENRPRVDFEKITDEASSRFPYYYQIYFTAYNYDRAPSQRRLTDVDNLARYAAKKTASRDGMSGYARFYSHIALCGCQSDLEAIDWPTMQIAMADMAEHYPTDLTYIRLIQLSCMRGQAEDARKYFAKLTVNDPTLWSADDWYRCHNLAFPSKTTLPEAVSPPGRSYGI